MPKENKSREHAQKTKCKYRLQRDSQAIIMITDCKECNGQANLKDSTCLSGVLTGLYNEYNVDSVILSHYIETKYTQDSMQILKMMVELLQDFEQLSIREPYNEYFKGNDDFTSQYKNQQKLVCEKCSYKPEKIFTRLSRDLHSDMITFFDTLGNISKEVGDNSNDDCLQCINATQSDLMYLFSKLEDLRSFVIYKGFQIVI